MVSRISRSFPSIGPAILITRRPALRLGAGLLDESPPDKDPDPRQSSEPAHDQAQDAFRGRLSR